MASDPTDMAAAVKWPRHGGLPEVFARLEKLEREAVELRKLIEQFQPPPLGLDD